MNHVPQFLMAGGVLAVVGIILVALFAGPDYGSLPVAEPPSGGGAQQVASTSPLYSAGGGGGGMAMPVAFVRQQATETPQQRVAPPLTASLKSYRAPTIQLSEAHWQGLEAIPLTSELKKKLELPPDLQGVLIDEATMAALDSGLRAGDVLVAVNGNPVKTLEGVLRESKRVKRLRSVTMTVQRGRRMVAGRATAYRRIDLHRIVLSVKDELGFAQVETAPMILSGDITPHAYRGPCTQCHAIGTLGHMVPDPDLITLPAPPIRASTPRPHQDRGPCVACHVITP